MRLVCIFAGFTAYRLTNWSANAKTSNFSLNSAISQISRCVSVCEIYYYRSSKRLSNGTETDDIELDVTFVCVCIARNLAWPRKLNAFLADSVSVSDY